LHWKHFLNVTKIVNEIPNEEPLLEDIFEKYWSKAGK
jgi:sulfoacetaldehyde dehydrogenase